MLFTKNEKLDIIRCRQCNGVGFKQYGRCWGCGGMAMGRYTKSKFLYWGEPLTKFYIYLRSGRVWLDKLQIMLVLLFAFGLLGYFILHIYTLNLLTRVFEIDYWLNGLDSFKSYFWISAVMFAYLLYRVLATEREYSAVEFTGYSEKKEISQMEEGVIKDMNDAKKIKRKNRIDISDTFTDEAKLNIGEAYKVALTFGSAQVLPIHLFYTMLSSEKVKGIFVRLNIPATAIQDGMKKMLKEKNKKKVPTFSEDFEQILFHAYENARNAHQEFVHITELLVATVRQSEVIQEILYSLNIEEQKLSNVVEWVRIRESLRRAHNKFVRVASHKSKHGMDRAMTAVATPFLNTYSEDLTLKAKFGHLDPAVARNKEIDEIFRIIEGGRQSVLLTGDHGVGKMSIIEGIAQRMMEDDVPKRLNDKRLVQISTSSLVAGTTMAGAQQRLINIMNEVGRAGNVILFIDNLHDVVGGGHQEVESLDLSETLVEYLGPGKFLTLATTTPRGYSRHITNTRVGSVFSRVKIKEMTVNQTIQVLESKVGIVEYKSRVFFSYDALEKCADLADKFLHDQYLPESAVGVMTETASYVRNKKGEGKFVTGEDVSIVVSEKTGIPVTSISEDESDRLLRLEDEMHKRVVGQEEAVTLVSNALRRARAEIRSEDKPIATFLFLGPTGVGKTELAKTVASVYFGGEQKMIRIDMSEYQDKSSIYRLIGQPGQQGTGILTEQVRKTPFSLVLLDELEKADNDILNLFLQVFDDGRLTDSVGRVIDFTNTIIIATSNAGTRYVQSQLDKGVSLENIRQNLIREELKQYYKPEFLNRFDGIVLFKSLTRDEIKRIAKLMLKGVESDLENRGVGLRIEDIALEKLAEVGFDPQFGARPMRRAIQEYVEDKLAELVISGKLKRRDTVVIGDGLSLKVESRPSSLRSDEQRLNTKD